MSPNVAYPEHLYHLTSLEAWEKIRQCGGLVPQVNPLGNYAFELNSFVHHWTRTTRFFGSATQAITLGLFGRGHDRLILLKLRVNPEEDEIAVQDLSSMFDRLDTRSYMSTVYTCASFPWGGKSIPELMIRTRTGAPFPLDRIEVLHEIRLSTFGNVKTLGSRRYDPERLCARILGREQQPLTWQKYKKIRFMKWHYRLLVIRAFLGRWRIAKVAAASKKCPEDITQ
ncbi:hypothetical protein GO308_14285 [Sphingomonas sp. SFZ2018-12]|uniref:hypothetical protein n=1 Tax=Sphingomonas sp. SFZ2018-12 TaxID=2683197 RepID=UPI001F0E8319|nr:hypothetical protein [Sphingomonas sp. SFZ2018-12]MCH4894287.1 hypothetical protein [Sphingomonas sp. SFZ2018-12]